MDPTDFSGGIIIRIDPILFRANWVSLRWYAVATALGIALGLYLTLRRARRRGLDEDQVYAVALWCLVAGILGGRLFHVIDKLDYYTQNPWLLLSLSQGGMAMWGALYGGLLACVVVAKARHIPLLPLLDTATIGLPVGQIIGRIGSAVNGESWGSPTDLPWGFVYTNPDSMVPPTSLNVPTHPYPIYEMLWCLVLLAFLVFGEKRWRADGITFSAYLIVYSVGRFSLTFVREEGAFLFGLQQAQVIALATLLVAIPYLVYLVTVRRLPERVTAS